LASKSGEGFVSRTQLREAAVYNKFPLYRVELLNALYRKVLCRNRVKDDQLTVTSLQALAKVYKEIGKFGDLPYTMHLIERVICSPVRKFEVHC
jgi:hypothetical protein